MNRIGRPTISSVAAPRPLAQGGWLRRSRLWTVFVVLACLLAWPLASLAGTTNYGQGINTDNVTWNAGFNYIYQYNQVWHSTTVAWEVYYYDGSYNAVGDVANNSNPTKWPYSISYGAPECTTANWPDGDYSGVQFTCQYGS